VFLRCNRYPVVRSGRKPFSVAAAEGGGGGGDEPKSKKVIRIKRSSKKSNTAGTAARTVGSKEISDDGRFVTMQLGSDADIQAADMDDRLQEARGWVSKKLSDDDAALLNRAMGIEEEVLAAMDAEDREEEGRRARGPSSKGRRIMDTSSSSSSTKASVKKTKDGKRMYDKVVNNDKVQAAAMVKGFLEMNPYICSGCGAPFQKKSPNTPGYLPADKLAAHRDNAGRIKDKQEAIRILEMAGIEIDSAEAADILRGANIGEDVIRGVRALAAGQGAAADATTPFLGSDLEHYEDDDDEGDIDESHFYDELYAVQDAAARGDSTDRALLIKERMREIKVEEAAYAVAAAGEEEEVGDDELDGLEIDLEELLQSMEGQEGGGDVSSALLSELAKAVDADKKSSSSSISARDQFLKDGLLINDIDAEANPAAKKNNAWREYARALDAETYEDFGAAAALKSAGKASSSLYGKQEEGSTKENGNGSSPIDMPVCICQRCYRLQAYGQVEQSLRPGWSDHDLLTPEHFQNLLAGIRDTNAVVLCLVDLFDLEGSILKNLKQIAGPNPIVIAANKADLLPRDASEARLTNWIHSEVRHVCGLKSPRENEAEVKAEIEERGWSKRTPDDDDGVLRRSNIHLVSCSNGKGMKSLLNSVMAMAADNGNRVYVMGAANVGKSSFINNMLEDVYEKKGSKADNSNKNMKSRQNKKVKNKSTPQATVSNLPGTTLNFLNIRLPNGVTMVDTPGLINEGQLTTKLTTDELRQVIPATPINPVTLRCGEGKTVMVGGLAKVEVLEGLPFFLTFFVSNEIALHPTQADKANDPEWVDRHIGNLLAPPATPERLAEIGPMESREFEVWGRGWKTAASDLVIAGLGWVSVTGSGMCRIRVTAPAGTSISQRDALLPYEASHSTAKFTGGKILKKSRKQGSGAQGYGWRAGSN
jgi:ribosome biogenesis GTPase A